MGGGDGRLFNTAAQCVGNIKLSFGSEIYSSSTKIRLSVLNAVSPCWNKNCISRIQVISYPEFTRWCRSYTIGVDYTVTHHQVLGESSKTIEFTFIFCYF